MITKEYNRLGEFLKIQGHGGNLSNEEEDLMTSSYLSDSIAVEEFKSEALKAFSDVSFDWKSTLSDYGVYESENDEDALSYAKMAVWDYAFPNQPLPK